MIYGNRFYDIDHKAIDVIISTDKNTPAFNYQTLDNLQHTHIDLDFEEPVVITQDSDDGLFSPIKSLGCTISIKTATALLDLYHADRQSVSVKVVKHLASTEPLSTVEEVAETTESDSPSFTSTPIDTPYDETIVFSEIDETHHIIYPADWVITSYAYDPEDYYIDSDNDNITVLRADPAGITVYYYLESDTTSTTSSTTTTTTDIPTSTTTPAYEWDNPSYGYPLDIDATAVTNPTRRKRYNGTACITDEPFILDNSMNQVLFMGYTSPAIYDQSYDIYDTLELECVDCLSSLQYVDVDLEKDTTLSWIEILGTAVQLMGGYKAFMLPTSYDKGEQCKDNIYQATNNFYDDDAKHTPWKWYDVIKEFCTTFGLSAIPYGQWIVFLDYYNITNEYDTYSNGTGYIGRYGYTYLFEEAASLATDIPYAGHGGSLQLSPCYNKIEISDSLYEQITNADMDDQMDDNTFAILSNCSPDYHSNLPYSGQFPQDIGYTYWRSFIYENHDTTMLYRFVKPNSTRISVGPLVHWGIDKTENIWRIYRQYVSPLNTIHPNNFTFVDLDIDMWKIEKDTQHVPVTQGTRPREYYYGHEFCWPLKYDCYDWNSGSGEYDVPSTITWKNCFLMRTLYSGEADATAFKPGIVKRRFPMLYTTEIYTGNVTWRDNDVFIISGAIGRSKTPFIRTGEESSTTNNVNVMIYIIGSDGRYYYLTKGLHNDYEAYDWDVRNIKKDFTYSIFEAQIPYLIPIPLENNDDLKGDAYVNFKDDVDFAYKLTESASGYVIPITNRLPINEGEIHVVPMGNYNTCHNYETPVGQYTFWKDLNIQVISKNENETYDKEQDTDVVYTNTVDTSYVSDFDAVQLKINTQQETKQASFSSILNMFGNHISYDTKFYYNNGDTLYTVEEILGNKLYAYYSTPKVIYTAEIEGGLVVPFTTIHENTMDKYMMVDAQELNVRSKVNTVTMCEVDKDIVSQVFTVYNRNKIGRNKYEQ